MKTNPIIGQMNKIYNLLIRKENEQNKRNYASSFKAKEALEAIKGELTVLKNIFETAIMNYLIPH